MLLVQSAIFIYWVDRPGEGNPRHAQLRRVLTAAAELGAVFDRRGSVDVGAVLRSQAEPRLAVRRSTSSCGCCRH